jgi:vacuolar-type H+-ATPase subunit B/Vma2
MHILSVNVYPKNAEKISQKFSIQSSDKLSTRDKKILSVAKLFMNTFYLQRKNTKSSQDQDRAV